MQIFSPFGGTKGSTATALSPTCNVSFLVGRQDPPSGTLSVHQSTRQISSSHRFSRIRPPYSYRYRGRQANSMGVRHGHRQIWCLSLDNQKDFSFFSWHVSYLQVRDKIQRRQWINRPPTEKVFFAEADTGEREEKANCGKSKTWQREGSSSRKGVAELSMATHAAGQNPAVEGRSRL